MTYIYEMDNLVSTDDRGAAIQYIQKGYALFTVPQMFGREEGQIVLYKDGEQNDDAEEILKRYEDEARNHIFGASESYGHTNLMN